MARPKKEINWDIVDKLIECGCSALEIAGKFYVNQDTFYRRFKEEYEASFQDYRVLGESAGNADLKAMLHAKALNNKAPGNAHMLIFLARTQLGMKEPDFNSLVPVHDDRNELERENIKLRYELEQFLRKIENQP